MTKKKGSKGDHSNKGRRIELGLAISGATLPPGQTRPITDIALYCDCSKQLIHTIEKRAIEKVREALRKRYGLRASQSLLEALREAE
jgi:hypothetical protein